jgi:hemerythrin-like domain-containing protein
MIEHRLIERMIQLMAKEVRRIGVEGKVDSQFIDTLMRFIRGYADRCHHGKEEDILFRELEKKEISSEHRKTMQELIEEHEWGRKTTAKLVDANKRYAQGDDDALPVILVTIQDLIDFYPEHIEKEDKHFFFPVMEYFSREEKDAMLAEGFQFDSNLLHEEHEAEVAEEESGRT